MRRTGKLLALIFLVFMVLSTSQVQIITPLPQDERPMSMPTDISKTSVYDSPNITAALSSPTDGSPVSGIFSINLDMTSDFATLLMTLFVGGAIYPSYDHVNITAGSSWTQVLSVDSSTLPEGMLNFTVLFEHVTERESVYLQYFVDNYAPNLQVSLYNPANGSTVSGLVSVDLNITSDYGELNLTLFVDGEPLSLYNPSLIGTGNISILVDTANVFQGYDNFTFYFQYNVLATHFAYAYHIVYLVDNGGLPISIDHLSPANQTEVAGVFNLTLLISSEYEPLNFTLFVDGVIYYPQYNNSLIGIKKQTISIDTVVLAEGPRNFTMLFTYNVTGENARAVYKLVFIVNNHGAPLLAIIAPSAGSTVTGITQLWLNITSTHPELFLNITVDGQITQEYNRTAILPGANNYTINTSRYENGEHTIGITAFTGEGASASQSLPLVFLDYVRVWLSGLTNHELVSGILEFGIRIQTPYQNVTASLYVDNQLVTQFNNITLEPGYNAVTLNTTKFTDGEHALSAIAYDAFGHKWEFRMSIIINNYGPPVLRFATTNAVTIGYAAFTIDVDSNWKTLNVTVYVDDVVLSPYENRTIDISSGEFTFYINMGAYSKTEHTVKVVMITPEGEKAEVERVFGFASIRIEEIASFALLLGAGIFIPLYRRRKGASLKPVLILDLIFALVTGAGFLILGINTLPFLVWHFNMASIWAIGGTFVFGNWVLPLFLEGSGKD
jgi:hypothetical protein